MWSKWSTGRQEEVETIQQGLQPAAFEASFPCNRCRWPISSRCACRVSTVATEGDFFNPLVKSNRLSPNLISVIATCRERHGTKRSLMTLRATRRQRSYLVLIFSCSSRPKRRKQLRQERRSPQAPAVAVLGLLGQQSKAALDVCWSCSLPFPPQCNIIIVPSSFLRKHT